MKTIKIVCYLLIGCMLVISPMLSTLSMATTYDDKPSAEEMLVDVFLVRPLGMITTFLGCGFFAASIPFSFMGGNTVDVFGELVTGPATFTFFRPVGELDY